jgi:hypothetical protein
MVRSLHNEQRTREDAMTNDDNDADVQISNWTLATGTKPGARYVYAPNSRSTVRHVEPEAKSS